MNTKFYFKCNVCKQITCLKYQVGYIENHPIRFKCQCGITLNGQNDHGKIHFQNAKNCNTGEPSQFITCSPEFLTNPPSKIESPIEFIFSPFMQAVMEITNYEDFKNEFQRILSYKKNGLQNVKNCNDLFKANNIEQLKQIVVRDIGLDSDHFPMINEADVLRTMNYVNQEQYMNEVGSKHLFQTQDLFLDVLTNHREQVMAMAAFLNGAVDLEKWRRDTVRLQFAVFDKIEYILPIVGIEYYKSGIDSVLKSNKVITTVSFDDIKTSYVDLYEHICRTAGVIVGLDNIITRRDFNKLRANSNIKGTSLEGFVNETIHGKIVNYLSDEEPFERLLGNYLNRDVRNSIGHFNYEAEEVGEVVPGTYGQTIKFIDARDTSKFVEKTLKEVCYYIWQMYKSLAEISEIIYRFQTILLSQNNIRPSNTNPLWADIVFNASRSSQI